jgi:hypothetical protein
VTHGVRLFAYGFLAFVLVLYPPEVGLTEAQVGVLLTLILLGDTAVSLWITTAADRLGRRRRCWPARCSWPWPGPCSP